VKRNNQKRKGGEVESAKSSADSGTPPPTILKSGSQGSKTADACLSRPLGGKSGGVASAESTLSQPGEISKPAVITTSIVRAPRDVLMPYQLAWVKDQARFKIGMLSRQTGKSFMVACELVEDSLGSPNNQWVILSAGERQALEFMEKVKQWSEAYSLAITDYQETRDNPQALIKQAEIRWSNGSRCLALPANPATARGYSANLALDEFAFHEKPTEIWRAIYPSISNPLKRQFKLRIVSTPNGKSNKFAELLENKSYSKHVVTIYDAVKQGLPVNIDELRAGLNDPEGWAQEYECQLLDSSAVLLPYDLIATCEAVEASEVISPDFFRVGGRRLVCGIDFGRKKDLTVCWTLERVGDVQWTREVLVLEKMPTPDQVDILRSRIRAASRVCLDYTGPGIGMGDYLVKEHGEYNPEQHRLGKVELCTFTAPMKADVFTKLRMRFESRGLRIPISVSIREDLHAVHRTTTPSGQVTYKAPHSEDGHSDRATALALAERAAGSMGVGVLESVEGIVIGNSQGYRPPRLNFRRGIQG
jgi:phage FluMu gp28-like protein